MYLLTLLPEVAKLERGLNPTLDRTFPSVTVRWNMLESAHFNHTERTTETKKKEKLYKDSQVKKPEIQNL